MKDFLSLVLPAEGAGYYAAWDGVTKLHSFVETIDELCESITRINDGGGVAYYATATFTEPTRRAEAVAAKRAFYLDIDFKNIEHADPFASVIQQLKAFSKQYGLSAPTYVVSTGGGIHVYWVLDADIDGATWLAYARGLKEAVKNFGIPADHAITADIARILRPIGTLNRKYAPPFLTEGKMTGKVYPLSAFAQFAAPTLTPQSEALRALDLPTAPTYKTFWINSIAASGECRLVTWALKPENQTRDQMDEALWSDLLATCSKAEDGVFYAHEFSRHDLERYSAQAVDQKLAAWKGQQHPRTCARLSSHGKCGSCQHAVAQGSPIRFGYTPPLEIGEEGSDPRDVIDALLTAKLREFYPDEDDIFLAQYKPLAKWPSGFGFDPEKFRTLRYEVEEVENEDGTTDRKMTVTPLWAGVFWPQHKMRDSDGTIKYEFVFWARQDEHPVRFVVPVSVYGSDQPLVNMLVRYGFPLAANYKKAAVTYFNRSLDLINGLMRDSLMADSLGWDDNMQHFNFGNAYASKTSEGIEIKTALVAERITDYGLNMSAAGTLANWKAAIATYEGEKREYHQFALMAGFASVLIPLTTQQWSHLIHVFSDASGSGKTSVQQAALSIWGEPRVDKGRSTYNAMIDRFSVYGCLPGIIDEITLLDGETLRRLALDVAAGEPRARLLQSGQRVIHGRPWTLIGLSSANIDIEYEISRSGNAEGEIARITAVEMPAGVLDFTNQDTFQLIQQNYGLAGRVFITKLMTVGLPAARAAINDLERELSHAYATSEGVRSALRFKLATFAAIIYANRLATQCGLTNFREADIRTVIGELLAQATVRVGNPAENIVQDIRTFLSTNNSFIPRLFRDKNGDLTLANRMDGLMSRSMSRVGNAQSATRSDVFLVVDDWPQHGVPTIHGTRPGLYVSKSQLLYGKRKLFPSVRTDPLKTVPGRLAGTGYSLEIVEETILGLRTEFVRVLLPTNSVDANISDTRGTVVPLTPQAGESPRSHEKSTG